MHQAWTLNDAPCIELFSGTAIVNWGPSGSVSLAYAVAHRCRLYFNQIFRCKWRLYCKMYHTASVKQHRYEDTSGKNVCTYNTELFQQSALLNKINKVHLSLLC